VTPAEAAALSSRRSTFSLTAPRLELDLVITEHDFIRKAKAILTRQIYDLRAECARCAPMLLKRQKGRRTKASQGQIIEVAFLRAERAEAYVLVLKFLLDRCNWRTGEVGRWEGDRIGDRYSVDQVVRGTRLSRDRVEHALSDLGAAGLIFRHQHREVDGGQWIGFVSATRLTIAFFDFVGLELERQGRIEQEREQREEAERRAAALERAAAKAEAERLNPFSVLTETDQEKARRLAWEIGRKNPDWTIERVEAEVLAQICREQPPPDPPPNQ